MNQQQQPVRKNPIFENMIRNVTPFVPASETIHTVSFFKNQPAWLGCLFTSFATVWFLRRWYVVTTEENVYFLKWGFGKIDPKNVFKVPRKDVQYIGDTLTFTAPNESKPRKLYSGLIGGDTRLKQELQNPGSFEVGSGGSIQSGAGVPQPISQPEQTSQPITPLDGQYVAKQTNGLAIISMVLGIASIPFSFCYGVGVLFGIAAFIMGLIARKQIQERAQEGSGKALTGIITGGITIVGVLAIVILALLGPAIANVFSGINSSLSTP
jgi:Domain of unknown function (DUF4190)